MKKIKQVFFIISLVGICLIGVYILYSELFRNDAWSQLKKDPTLLIPVFVVLLSLLSLFFNLEKIGENNRKSNIYKVTRISDMLFSIGAFLFAGIATYFLIDNINPLEDVALQLNKALFPIAILIFLYVLSILLFIDNLKYHKSIKKLPQKDSIDDIGKG